MDNNLVVIAIGAVLGNALILYIVIAAATRADRRLKYEWAQMDLLAKIARAQGVPEEEIQKTFKAI